MSVSLARKSIAVDVSIVFRVGGLISWPHYGLFVFLQVPPPRCPLSCASASFQWIQVGKVYFYLNVDVSSVTVHSHSSNLRRTHSSSLTDSLFLSQTNSSLLHCYVCVFTIVLPWVLCV